MSKTVVFIIAIIILAAGGFFAYKNNLLNFNSASNSDTMTAQIKEKLAVRNELSVNDITVGITKTEGKYAKGTANGPGGGGIWFAVKQENEWNIVWDGNGITPCIVLEPYKDLPKSLLPSCWDTKTDTLVNR